jgi:hypothetical protein
VTMPSEPRGFIRWCIEQHAEAAEVLRGPEREAWLVRVKTGRMADPVWHERVNERYRAVLEALG